jgi:hypothetical protein
MKKSTIVFAAVLAVLAGVVFRDFNDGFYLLSGTAGESNAKKEAVSQDLPPLAVSSGDVRAVYLTAAAASVPSWVERTIYLIKSTHLNAVVINVKDSDGTYLNDAMKGVVKKFREQGIYPIARVVVFQDNGLAKQEPSLALRDVSGNLWSGNGGYLWVDPASEEVWARTVAVTLRALDLGFAEVNFDYIRFPDGNVGTIVFPFYDGTKPETEVLKDFFRYLTERVREARPNSVLSADLFAYTLLRNNGLGVGQRVGDAAQFFDVVSPIIYPSHYAPNNFGFPNPAEEPYQVVLRTLESGKELLAKTSSTAIIRPWLQDFDMGAVYDKRMVEEEIKAVRDAGYGDTWMIWNPTNIYDREKFSGAQK